MIRLSHVYDFWDTHTKLRFFFVFFFFFFSADFRDMERNLTGTINSRSSGHVRKRWGEGEGKLAFTMVNASLASSFAKKIFCRTTNALRKLADLRIHC